MPRKRQRQPRLPADKQRRPQRRAPSITGLAPIVREHFEKEANRRRRSLSWLIADIISDAIGIDCTTGEPYATRPRRRKAGRKARR